MHSLNRILLYLEAHQGTISATSVCLLFLCMPNFILLTLGRIAFYCYPILNVGIGCIKFLWSGERLQLVKKVALTARLRPRHVPVLVSSFGSVEWSQQVTFQLREVVGPVPALRFVVADLRKQEGIALINVMLRLITKYYSISQCCCNSLWQSIFR